jgi:hypothetical protein
MGLYRFHIRDASGLVEDEEGMDLPDLHAALAEALRCTRELMEDAFVPVGLQLEITDETGRALLIVPIYGTNAGHPHRERAQVA